MVLAILRIAPPSFRKLDAKFGWSCQAFSASNHHHRLRASEITEVQQQLQPLLQDDDEIRRRDQNLVEVGRRELERFFDFPLDDWQLQAGGAIWEGYNVIVSAPTGAGKVREEKEGAE